MVRPALAVCGDLKDEDILASVQSSNPNEDETAEDDEDARVESDRLKLSTKNTRDAIDDATKVFFVKKEV
ncbi:hypothetical protein J6590_042982 [Homalodisca vitripennis]|nr:hypothetical protein J6590_042982 [Homalodisca vitripennis]